VVDAVSSQRSVDRAAGIHRAAQSGAFLVTSEMALFQLMQVRHHVSWLHCRIFRGLFCRGFAVWWCMGSAGCSLNMACL
jgi:hypothetical protein